VHGAGASKKSFNWLNEHLNKKNKIHFFSYDMYGNIPDCVKKINEQIDLINEPTVVIGHSLGGLLAADVCDNKNVEKIITMSTPLGGILAVGLFGLMNSNAMFRELLPYSNILYEIKKKNVKIKKPHMAIVTTHGLPIISEENDGVVMVSSQMSWETPIYKKYDLNHFEVLMSQEILEEIKKFIY
jgi:predicted alpha/beta hydrolase family esterase